MAFLPAPAARAPAAAAVDPVDLLARTVRGMAAGLVARLPYLAVAVIVLLLFHADRLPVVHPGRARAGARDHVGRGRLRVTRSTWLTTYDGERVILPNFAVYFWTDSHQADVLRVRDRVATGIKLALDDAKIDMPFPHQVVLFHDQTGNGTKDAAGDRPALGRPGQ